MTKLDFNQIFYLNNGALNQSVIGGAGEKYLIEYSDWREKPVQDGYVTDGVELVNNGDFSDGLNGWNVTNEGQIVEVSNEELHILTDGSIISANQVSFLEIGTTYYATISVRVISNGLRFRAGGEILDINTDGEYNIGFTATETYLNIYRLNSNPAEFYVDNVSVQKVIQEPNKRYIKDEGISPKYPLALNSGQGKYFNGVNSEVNLGYVPKQDVGSISIVVGEQEGSASATHLYNNWGSNRLYLYRDGGSSQIYQIGLGATGGIDTNVPNTEIGLFTLEWDTGNWYLYVNNILRDTGTYSGTVADEPSIKMYIASNRGIDNRYQGWLKDFYYFSRRLTEAERTKQYQYPEDFFIDIKTGVITDCILNVPMNDKDDHVRDYVSYSAIETTTNSNFDSDTDWTKTQSGGTAEIVNGEAHIVCPDGGSNPTIEQETCIVGRYYEYTIKQRVIINNGVYKVGNVTIVLNGDGEFTGVIQATGVNSSCRGGFAPREFYTDYFIVKELSGIYPVVNPTNDTNDLAKQLPYGLQDSKLVTDSLGVIESKSLWFEGNGLGYGDTGWKFDKTKDTLIRFIFDYKKDGIRQQWGSYSSNNQQRLMFNKHTTGEFFCYFGNIFHAIPESTMGNDGYKLVECHLFTNGTFNVYVNGILVSNNISYDITTVENTFRLGNELSEIHQGLNSEYRLHIVDTETELTQEEVTEAYSKAIKDGFFGDVRSQAEIDYTWFEFDYDVDYVTDGVELVTNGDFSNGLDGWGGYANGTATREVIDNQLHMTTSGDDVSIQITDANPDDLHLVTFDVTSITGSWIAFPNSISATISTTGLKELLVSDSYLFRLKRSTAGTIVIDNVSVKKVIQEPGRYIENKGDV